MATFSNLYHATEALKHVLLTRIVPPPSVLAAPAPADIPATEEIRISLAWINEQPSHKNDGYHRNHDGTHSPPRASLSVFFLVTTAGEDLTSDALTAHRLLGEVVKLFHAEPVIELPIAALPNNSGNGKLNVTLVPMTPELMEKLFAPLQIKHRPFALYEVWPIQLESPLLPTPASPVVAPHGLRLDGPTVASPPSLSRLVPTTVGAGGFLRIDGVFPSPVDALWIGTHKFTALTVPPLVTIDAQRSVGLQLPTAGPDAIPPGVHRVSVVSGKLASNPTEVRVLPAGQWALEGPMVLQHSRAVPLVLQGSSLDQASQLHVWPESGIRVPSDVRQLAVVKTPTSVEADVSTLPAGVYRFAVEIDLGPGVPVQFTPYVTLEITP